MTKKKKIIPYEQIDDNIEHYNDNTDISDNITDRDEEMQEMPNQIHNPVRSQSINNLLKNLPEGICLKNAPQDHPENQNE